MGEATGWGASEMDDADGSSPRSPVDDSGGLAPESGYTRDDLFLRSDAAMTDRRIHEDLSLLCLLLLVLLQLLCLQLAVGLQLLVHHRGLHIVFVAEKDDLVRQLVEGHVDLIDIVGQRVHHESVCHIGLRGRVVVAEVVQLGLVVALEKSFAFQDEAACSVGADGRQPRGLRRLLLLGLHARCRCRR